MPILIPDLLYLDGRFQGDTAVEFDAASGRIVRVGRATGDPPGAAPDAAGAGSDAGTADAAGPAGAPAGALRLRNRALLPGFVNAHSHAFQRVIRGRTQWRRAGAPAADFWSWREAMYSAALALGPDDVFAISRFCFLEMLRTGITAVGEFHYLHRDPDGRRYDDPAELALRVLEAAEDVGLRIALLNVCYAAGGIGRAPAPHQRRFVTGSLDEFLADTDRLAGMVSRYPRATVGLAPHSVRAVPRPWLAELARRAAEDDVAIHMHVSEQPAEVEACVEAYGLRPVELLADDGILDGRFTAVHATHLTAAEIGHLGGARAGVCVCPTTERDLGDGVLPAAELLDAGATLALGTDSQTVIDMFDEMRSLEYHERLRRLRRVVLTRPGGTDRLEVAPVLLAAATTGGARTLALDAGRVAPGALADFLAVDLEHPAIAGWTADSLPPLLALSAPPSLVTDVWVAGLHRYRDRQHPLDEEAATAFDKVARESESQPRPGTAGAYPAPHPHERRDTPEHRG